jgi:Ser/Thr protein kinase RdoA (MazF antagonist)
LPVTDIQPEQRPSAAIELFAPDHFSVSEPVFEPIMQSNISAEITQVFASYKGTVGAIRRIAAVGGMEINSANFQVETEAGKFIAKRTNSDPKRIAQICQLATWLADQNLPVAGPITTDERTWCTASENGFWSLWESVDGSYFTGHSEELAPVAQAIVSLHENITEIPKSLRPLVQLDFSIARFVAICDECHRRREHWPDIFGTSHSHLLGEHWESIERTLMEVQEAERAIRNEQIAICHYDLHPRNLLMDNLRVAAVLDLDSIGPTRQATAVGFALFKLLRQAAVFEGTQYQSDASRSMRDKFKTAILSAECFKRLAGIDMRLFAKLEIFRRLCLILENAIFSGDQRWLPVLNIQILGLYETDILFEFSAAGESIVTTHA